MLRRCQLIQAPDLPDEDSWKPVDIMGLMTRYFEEFLKDMVNNLKYASELVVLSRKLECPELPDEDTWKTPEYNGSTTSSSSSACVTYPPGSARRRHVEEKHTWRDFLGRDRCFGVRSVPAKAYKGPSRKWKDKYKRPYHRH